MYIARPICCFGINDLKIKIGAKDCEYAKLVINLQNLKTLKLNKHAFGYPHSRNHVLVANMLS
jgi:hypothetical protein